MPRSRSSVSLVAAQFLLLGLLLFSGPLIPSLPWLLLWPTAALLAGWSLLALRLRRLSVWPDPLPQAELVTDGPYRLIRHPIYSALLLGGLAAVIAGGPLWRWPVWLALLAVLITKLRYEERLLEAQIPAYAAYRRRTWRLLPLIW
jgi:protein-S-isoprenylcysteine O-methyltransferase Ste14